MSENFLGRANSRGYKYLLIDKGNTVPESSILEPTEIQIQMADHNDTSYGELIAAMDTGKSAWNVAFQCCKGNPNPK